MTDDTLSDQRLDQHVLVEVPDRVRLAQATRIRGRRDDSRCSSTARSEVLLCLVLSILCWELWQLVKIFAFDSDTRVSRQLLETWTIDYDFFSRLLFNWDVVKCD